MVTIGLVFGYRGNRIITSVCRMLRDQALGVFRAWGYYIVCAGDVCGRRQQSHLRSVAAVLML